MENVLDEHEEYVRQRIEVYRTTHKQLSDELQRMHPGIRGLSVRSIEKFCRDRGIHKSSCLSIDCVQIAVKEAVSKVCVPVCARHALYGRKQTA